MGEIKTTMAMLFAEINVAIKNQIYTLKNNILFGVLTATKVALYIMQERLASSQVPVIQHTVVIRKVWKWTQEVTVQCKTKKYIISILN